MLKNTVFSLFAFTAIVLYNTLRVIIMVGILLEPKFSESVWCKNIYEDLIEELRQKRIPFCEIFDVFDGKLDTIFIIATGREWITSTITQLNQIGIHPILINHNIEKFSNCIYSSVYLDTRLSVINLLESFKAKNLSRIALYGFNSNSLSDVGYMDNILSFGDTNFEFVHFFNNSGSLEDCFNDFFEHIDNYDVILCTNDYAAISLLLKLEKKAPEKLKNLHIVSQAQTNISTYYNKILPINFNRGQCGKAAVYVYNSLKKHLYISEMHINVSECLENSDTVSRPQNIRLTFDPSEEKFYDDKEIAEMLIVDRFLESADSIEKKIIDLLLNKKTIAQISELCFLTVGGVNYKINKIINNCGAKNKEEFISLLKKYIYRKG